MLYIIQNFCDSVKYNLKKFLEILVFHSIEMQMEIESSKFAYREVKET